MNGWCNPLVQGIKPTVLAKVLPTKGKLVYEYNPFRNYRLSKEMYEFRNGLYTYEELVLKFGVYLIDKKNGEIIHNTKECLNKTDLKWVNTNEDSDPVCRMKGELVDFITDLFNFSLNNPVHIIPLYSYDGSVNLILNDGLNQPRLINSRFSATGKNTYEIVDRKGNNDTNIYDLGDLFDVDTSLYKRVTTIPKLKLNRIVSGGQLKVGNYHFYFKLSDADGNETDFVAESGLVSVFIGEGQPSSLHTGNANENSGKQVIFTLSNIDPSYDYVSVYYSRSYAEDNLNVLKSYNKIDRKYIVSKQQLSTIIITGYEDVTPVTSTDINLQYNVVDAANCTATAQGMLFMANVHKPDIPYNELTDLSLRFLPYLKNETYKLDIDEEYNITSSTKGYFDPNFIYSNVGYWNNEIYRLGIVYILSNGELSPVFNIRGRAKIKEFDYLHAQGKNYDNQYNHYEFTKVTKNGEKKEVKIQYNESNYYTIPPVEDEGVLGEDVIYENVKGVISLDSSSDSRKIHSIEVRTEDETIRRLKKLGIKGYFFVRQKRMPLTLALGITLGIDNVSNTPTIPTVGGVLEELGEEIDGHTYVETENIFGLNFISEGFLTRYKFDKKYKSSSLWGKLGKIIVKAAITTAVVAGAAISVAFPALALAEAAIYAAIVAASVAATAAAATAVAATTLELIHSVSYAVRTKKLEGRNTKIEKGCRRVELKESRLVGGDFKDRIIITDGSKNRIGCIICPDYTLDQAYYNLLFTGQEFSILRTLSQSPNTFGNDYYFINDDRHFYMPYEYSDTFKRNYNVPLLAVPDSVSCVTINDEKFRSRAGWAEEVFRYECVGNDFKVKHSFNSTEETVKELDLANEYKETNSDIIRGSFSPYIAMSDFSGNYGETVLIMIPGYNISHLDLYFDIRMHDSSPFYAISDRMDINDLKDYELNHSNLSGDTSENLDIKVLLFRGDCYICQYTQRIFRNFNDPTAPYNDRIVDSETWKKNYKINESEKWSKINLGDVNAVEQGMWITFSIRSNNNLNIRTLNLSFVDETAKMGHPRGYFPYHGMVTEGSYKSEEANIYNKAFSTSVSERYNFEVPDVPYIKNWYGTRIMYSDVHVNDSFKNGFRVFKGTAYRDYTREYGEIVKILNYKDDLLVVFEHGLALAPVNEKALIAQAQSGNTYITTNSVLPEKLQIISESYGSQWPDSVIITPLDGTDSIKVFGVDTVGKKIWCYDGTNFLLISDFRVLEFLNNNISLSERELTPVLGIRNVKTVYNAFKHDVLFTFYDNLNGFEEKVWNLCYNTLLKLFITFYSWVPSFMENINNIPFSFNRNVSKWIAKLGVSHKDNSFADGIVLNNNIYLNNRKCKDADLGSITYLTKDGTRKKLQFKASNSKDLIGILGVSDNILPLEDNLEYYVKFELSRDIFKNYEHFTVKKCHTVTLPNDAMYLGQKIPIYGLFFKRGDTKLVFGKDGNEEYDKVMLDSDGNLIFDSEGDKEAISLDELVDLDLFSELYYRNRAGHSYPDWSSNKVTIGDTMILSDFLKLKLETNDKEIKLTKKNYVQIVSTLNLPPYKSREGKRVCLESPINYDKIIQLLNIKATIYAYYAGANVELGDFLNYVKGNEEYDEFDKDEDEEPKNPKWISCGIYKSQVAITSKWNSLFLSSDFWKHGLAGIIDIADKIKPTMWYGEQHPFEFEVIVADNFNSHKIFTNLELIANKARPDSFHYEIVGDAYEFAKDKENMFWRQEARKALMLYNGVDITYDRNFLQCNPKLNWQSYELVHNYYERVDTLDKIYDNYEGSAKTPTAFIKNYVYDVTELEWKSDYAGLSGAELVYYPNLNEYRIWQHLPAIDIKTLSLDSAESIVRANCEYLEDKWRVVMVPLLIVSRNEFTDYEFTDSEWTYANDGLSVNDPNKLKLPQITIYNTYLPDWLESVDFPLYVKDGEISQLFPEQFPNRYDLEGEENALYDVYDWEYAYKTGKAPWSEINWLDQDSIVNYDIYSNGQNHNRQEASIRDKFIKIRVRYSGEDLAIIHYLNTIYQISYA